MGINVCPHASTTRLAPGDCTAPYIDAFVLEQRTRGYAALTIREHRRGVRHLGRWADHHGLTVTQLDEAVLVAFAAHLPTCQCGTRHKGRFAPAPHAARQFVDHLRRRGVLAAATPQRPPMAPLMEEFRGWMRTHRGVVPRTLDNYAMALRPFFATLGDDPARYDVAGLRAFVLAQTQSRGACYAKWLVTAIHAWLRFLVASGRCRPDFQAAVPRVPQWRLAALPRYLPSDVVERVIAACPVDTPCGLRDRAILLLLARLGLRAGDVAALRLADLDWSAGTVRVCGKGRRQTLLPLPQDVGEAALAYLERGRPRVPLDQVFLCATAPHRAFAGSYPVTNLVAAALRRAAVHDAPTHGAHLLRHSAATAMLRAGGTLEAIGQVLRHKSVDTTAYYAKVDVAMLAVVAQPWPAGAPC
jgi:integrase/recombinase XerD